MHGLRFKRAFKAVIFTALLFLHLGLSGRVLKPVFENGFDTVNGFYAQPEDTIEVLFLGTSVVKDGISPMELFEEEGICAYSLATSGQPVMASYYWLLEACRSQGNSLKTIVLDVSSIRHSWDEAKYKIAFSEMRLSPVKIKASMACTSSFDEFLEYISPIPAYHTRWKELTPAGLSVLKGYKENGMRGFWMTESQVIESMGHEDISAPLYFEDASAENAALSEEAVNYLAKMREFCLEKKLNLLLIKTPTYNWTDAEHNAVEALADEMGLSFLDYNYEPLITETGYNRAADSQEGDHLNYRGAFKLTKSIGAYLTETGLAASVKDGAGYGFMEDDLLRYKRNTLLSELNECTDPVSFLEAGMRYEGFTIFITVSGDCTKALTKEQREAFLSLGLTGLSGIGYAESYIGVIENQAVIHEKTGGSGAALEAGLLTGNGSGNGSDPLSLSGKLYNGKTYSLLSGGYKTGYVSSCVIDGAECSGNARGINIAVYDHENGVLIKHLEFDTAASPVRMPSSVETAYNLLLESGTRPEEFDGVYRELYLYNEKCRNVYEEKGRAAGTLK